MKLTDLKRTKADQKAQSKGPSVQPEPYPYGTRISLGEDELGKLGVEELPKVGQKMHLRAHAVVHSTSSDEGAGGKRHRRLELQVQKMALEKRGAANAGSMQDAVDNGIDEADGD
ncbi:MAG: capsid staple protein [Steroidobacteraceae bacterium]